jgi:PAS domain S-box-containing protein
MSIHTQAIVFNGVPLAVLSALYLGMAAALAPVALREWRRATALEIAFLSLFPVLGLLTGLFAIVVLIDEEPFGGHVWFGLASILVAAFPPIAVLVRWRERHRLIDGWLRSRETDARVAFVDRELDSVAAVSNKLGRARDASSVARALLAQVGSLLSVDLTVLVLVDERKREATGVLGFSAGRELDWVSELRLDLDAVPSGIAHAVSQRAPVVVEDAESSPIINRELAESTGVKSAIFVPLVAGKRVIGVLVAGTTGERRVFAGDELALLQAVAAEGALALDRVRSSEELADALERERLVARIARKVRSELDLDAVLGVAVSETGRALGLARCFIRLGSPGAPMPVEAEWDEQGVVPVRDRAERLPASNLAARRNETVAIADAATAEELEDPSLGGRETLLEIGTHAVLATPIVVFDRMIGVFALHRHEPSPWSPEEVKLAEAVAREVGLAVHTARLLSENEERLEHLSALIKAAQVVSAELRPETVLQRLVVELANLLQADAADCYLREPGRGTLRCAAVHGLDQALVGFESPEDLGLAGRALEGRGAVISHEYVELPQAFPHPAYDGFASALVAPMTGGGEVSGVLGVGTRDPDRRFTRADRETIEAFAGLAGLALRNAASFEERVRRGRVERGFYLVASVLAQPLSLVETLDALAQAAAEALGGDCSSVLMPQAGALELAGRHELTEPLKAGLGQLPEAVAEAARRGQVLAASDILADSRFEHAWSTLARGSFRSLLAIPVEAGDDERGVVIVFFAEERSFTDDDLELAGHFADAAKGALERSELFERERTARALSQQLARIGTFLATELDPDRVMAEVVAEAPGLLAAQACTIRVAEGGELVFLAGGGEGADALIGSRTPSTTGLAGEVAQTRAPVAVSAAGEQRSTDADGMLAAGYDSYLGVPLSGPEGGLLGVLSVYARGPRRWRNEEIEALVALAANASAALSNAELYQRIALEKNRSDAILAHVADGIVAVDRDGRVVLWNEAASQITGIDRAEAIGRDPAEILKRSLAAAEGYETSGSRILSIPRGGEDVWLSLSEAVMRDPTGSVAGRIYAFRDISAERLVEQMKSDFVSTVSHQLRAPLTSIYGFAETLLRHDVNFTDEERRTFLQYVASESERLTAIVDTLLNVARLEAGDLQVKLAPIDIHSLLAEVVSSTEPSGSVNGHELVLELPAEPLAAEADDEKLRQVLANLLDNAIKYSPEGGRVTVSARRKPESGTVEVAVVDEGMGIPQAEHQLIFSKFYRRSDMGGQEGMGAGLGLFIAEGLVSAMGGSIRVSSVEGRGSSFVFELPLAPGAFERRPKEASPS